MIGFMENYGGYVLVAGTYFYFSKVCMPNSNSFVIRELSLNYGGYILVFGII